MMILEQFKLLNLNFKMRKLWTDEVGGLKTKKIEKNAICNF